MDLFYYLYLSLSCCDACSRSCSLVVTSWERASLFGFLIFDVFACFCYFPFGVLGQLWYLIVSISDLCSLPNLEKKLFLLFNFLYGNGLF